MYVEIGVVAKETFIGNIGMIVNYTSFFNHQGLRLEHVSIMVG